MILYSMCAHVQFAGNLPVAKALTHEINDLVFPAREQNGIAGVQARARQGADKSFENHAQLLAARPDLAFMNFFETLRKYLEWRVAANNALRSCAEAIDHQVSGSFFEKHDRGNVWARCAQLS